jgi:hypothetical protein
MRAIERQEWSGAMRDTSSTKYRGNPLSLKNRPERGRIRCSSAIVSFDPAAVLDQASEAGKTRAAANGRDAGTSRAVRANKRGHEGNQSMQENLF